MKKSEKELTKIAFTLVELLAVIVILGALMVITVPKITAVLKDAEQKTNKTSAENLAKATELKASNNEMTGKNQNIVINYQTGENIDYLDYGGEKPEKGKVAILENGQTGMAVKIGKKCYTKQFSSSNINVKEYNEETCKIAGSFAEDSWADIKANLTVDRNAYEIGSTKIIEFDRDNNGINEYYKLRLVNTSPCSSSIATSKTSCGVVIEFATAIGRHRMTSSNSNEGGWYASEMRSYLNTDNNSIYSKLNSVIGKDAINNDIIITTTPVVSGSGYGNDIIGGGTSENAEDYLYLLSTREVGLSVENDSKDAETDTNILSYYNSNNTNNARKKYEDTTSTGVDSTPIAYWLRSANSYNSIVFYAVEEDGSYYSHYPINGSYYVIPAFRILD